MRKVALLLALVVCGCVGSSEPRNPFEKRDGSTAAVTSANVAAIESADAAPVASAAPTAVQPTLTRVQAMKELFLKQRAAEELREGYQQRFLRLAHGLSIEELAELNEFLGDYGVRLNRKCQNPDHNHDEENPDDKQEDEEQQGDGHEKGEAF